MTRTHVYIGGPWHKRVITSDAPAHYKEFPKPRHSNKCYIRVRTFGEHRQSIIWVWADLYYDTLSATLEDGTPNSIISVDVSMRLNFDLVTEELWVELNEAQP